MINMVFWNNECLQVLDAYLSLGVLETWLVLGLNPKILNLEKLNFYFFDKDTLPFHDELPKQPEHQTFKPRQNPENYEPCQKHLVPKPGHQTHQVFKPTKLWTFKQQGLDQPLNINLVIIFEPTFEWVRQ